MHVAHHEKNFLFPKPPQTGRPFSLSGAVILGNMRRDSSAYVLASIDNSYCLGETNLPLGSDCFDHVGAQRMTVDAHDGGKCSSNIRRYQ